MRVYVNVNTTAQGVTALRKIIPEQRRYNRKHNPLATAYAFYSMHFSASLPSKAIRARVRIFRFRVDFPHPSYEFYFGARSHTHTLCTLAICNRCGEFN